jgi:SAM-dependent methyltransferase
MMKNSLRSGQELVGKFVARLEGPQCYAGVLRTLVSDPAYKALGWAPITVWQASDQPTEPIRGDLPVSHVSVDGRLFAPPLDNENEAAGLQRICTELGGRWPDILILDLNLDRRDSGLDLMDALARAYHVVEPGGVLAIPLDRLESAAVARITAALQELLADRPKEELESLLEPILQPADGMLTLRKENSIYLSPHVHIAHRERIFQPETCQLAVERTVDRLDLQAGARLLDVGVGDGRFSQHFLRAADRLGWVYTGLEMTPHPELQPQTSELTERTRFATNFFSLDPSEEQYDVIVLFYVFHALRLWPLFLYQAARLLRPGGKVLISNRTDSFLRWTHGDLRPDEFAAPQQGASPILVQCRNYWRERAACGLRVPDQISTATDPDRCVRAAEQFGLTLKERIQPETQRHYKFWRTDLCPDDGGPAMWNVGRVGVTSRDLRRLRSAFSADYAEDTLPENVIVSTLERG